MASKRMRQGEKLSEYYARLEREGKEMKGESRLYEEQHFFNFVEGVFRAKADVKTTLDTIYDEFQRIKKIPW